MMNEPIYKISTLADELLAGTKTQEEISDQFGTKTLKRVEEFIRTDYQYDCHGG